MNHHLTFIIVAFVFLALLCLMQQSDYLEGCEDLTSKLPEGLLENIAPFLYEQNWEESDAEFWECSAGVGGIWERFRATMLLVRLCQNSARHGKIEGADFMPIIRSAGLQAVFTIIALPEILWCKALGTPHISARLSAEFLASTFARAYTLLYVSGAPDCFSRMQTF